GSILVTEMTGSFQHLPALITVSMTAYIVADLLKSRPIYDQLLDRVLIKKQRKSQKSHSNANTVLEAVVCLGSQLEGKMIKDVNWPQHCLLINIKRGEEQIIPRGDTKIITGDYLNILTDEKQASRIKPSLLQMAGHIQSAVHEISDSANK
ncbi:MAG: TrkA C-terminal domain-containing protein, partial [Syntrophomonadaceae bacterium]|nr:TrkA C-terminal domain-containing protein [Syntrophomonadaceae bacterium]